MSEPIDWKSLIDNQLRRAGWYQGRHVSTRVVRVRLRMKGFRWFPAVADLLSEYGGLAIDVTKAGSVYREIGRDTLKITGAFSTIACVPLRCLSSTNGDAVFLKRFFSHDATLFGYVHAKSKVMFRAGYFNEIDTRAYILDDGSIVSTHNWGTLTRLPDFMHYVQWLIGAPNSGAEKFEIDREDLNAELESLGLI